MIDSCYSVYRPNLKAKSDADILRDAKLEAMGLPPQDDMPKKSHYEKPQMATDELVSQLQFNSINEGTSGINESVTGYGTLQEANAKIMLTSNNILLICRVLLYHCKSHWISTMLCYQTPNSSLNLPKLGVPRPVTRTRLS